MRKTYIQLAIAWRTSWPIITRHPQPPVNIPYLLSVWLTVKSGSLCLMVVLWLLVTPAGFAKSYIIWSVSRNGQILQHNRYFVLLWIRHGLSGYMSPCIYLNILVSF